MASSNVDKNTILTCVQMRCDHYVTRPFDKKFITHRIEKLGFGVSACDGQNADNPSSQDEGISHGVKEELKRTLLRIVQEFKDGKIELPVLPGIFNELHQVMKNPQTTVTDLTRVIEKDAVICIRIIAAANSPFYRGAEKVTSVKKAIPRLGFRETASMVSAISNKNL
ncbi:MAG: HDOD domain-containing protein [Deltaproteobacteria bacterium]|nr:HDOD domain-containing protein [Deltaproteobacteria bacterium]